MNKTYKQMIVELNKRNIKIKLLRQAGWTLPKLSEKFGITTQRIHTICTKDK